MPGWDSWGATPAGANAVPAAEDWGGVSGDDGWGAGGNGDTAQHSFDDGYADNGAAGVAHDRYGADNYYGNGNDDAGGDDKCFGCGESGHRRAECPNGGGGDDKCFGCGEVEHRRADCPNPQEMVCRYCKQPGHMIKDCPEKPPMMCNNCGEEGHMAKTCENARKVNRDDVANVSPEDAWDKIKTAANERDIDDAKEGIQEYIKALNGELTLRELQQGLMEAGIKLFLIGMERPLLGTFTNMDFQGNTGKKYSISYRFSDRPQRPKEKENWPGSHEEILARLDDAGEVVDSGMRRCNNCGEIGHRSKECPEEKVDKSDLQPKVTCFNCKEDGHRTRDCTQPRVSKSACRKCGEEGHMSRECPNSQGGGGACFNCGEEGHRKGDCPNPPSGQTCYNCGEEGHRKSDCPQPRAQRPMTCYNCNEEGHRASECPSNN